MHHHVLVIVSVVRDVTTKIRYTKEKKPEGRIATNIDYIYTKKKVRGAISPIPTPLAVAVSERIMQNMQIAASVPGIEPGNLNFLVDSVVMVTKQLRHDAY
jgi:hypothetical protein